MSRQSSMKQPKSEQIEHSSVRYSAHSSKGSTPRSKAEEDRDSVSRKSSRSKKNDEEVNKEIEDEHVQHFTLYQMSLTII